MRKLLEVTDTRTRMLQMGLMAGCGLLGGFGVTAFRSGLLPSAVAIVVIVASLLGLVVAAGVKQRWDLEYRGHGIRFENSPITGERLYLDEGLVARGGVGMRIEMRAPIRVGEGAGEVIVALVDAGFRRFRLRLFIDADDLDAVPPPTLPAETTGQPTRTQVGAEETAAAVRQSSVIGTFTVAKHILELVASVIGVIGGISAMVAWLS